MSFLFTTPATMRSQRLSRPSEERCGQAAGDGSGSRDLRLRCHPSELRHARCHVDEAAAEFGLGPAERYQFVFAVNEAVTNAIRHGEPDSDGTIGLRIAVGDDTLICSVNDRGRLVASHGDADPFAEGGRGLRFMARLTDEIELLSEDQGTTVRLYKRRSISRVEPDE
jgi:anti-sigma regulatory factor (Ser/Thr protein kinase)